MFGMTPYATAWVLVIGLVLATVVINTIVIEIGKTRRSAHEAAKAKAEAVRRVSDVVRGKE
jgi:hypothetical protein